MFKFFLIKDGYNGDVSEQRLITLIFKLMVCFTKLEYINIREIKYLDFDGSDNRLGDGTEVEWKNLEKV